MFVLRLILFVFLPVAAVSVPKKKRKMKDLNKKEAVGDLLDAFKEVLGAEMPLFIHFRAFTVCLMSLQLPNLLTLATTEI